MRFLLLILFIGNMAFAQDVYSIKEKHINGSEFLMSELKGKVVLIVNIASQCGYTSQIKDLEALYLKYKTRGLVVLGVPTNDFGGQTPEDDKGMAEFCTKNYNVTFPVLTKKTILGENKRELYKLLTEQTPKGIKGEVGWNFEKFLVNRTGVVVERRGSSAHPLDSEMTRKIESLL